MNQLLKLSAFLLGITSAALAVDGIAVSVHSNDTDPFGRQDGAVVRHVIRNDSVVSSTPIYSGTDAHCVCISPSGGRIAFIRTSDSKLCITGINAGSEITVIGDVGGSSWIDWAGEDTIFYVRYFGHVSVRYWNLATGGEGYFASLERGIASLSASTDSNNGIRVTAIMHDEASGDYLVKQLNNSGIVVPNGEFRNPGCASHISPDGSRFTLNDCPGTGEYHRTLAIWNWDATEDTTLAAPAGEYWNRARWAVNNNQWIISTVGMGKDLLQYHDVLLHTADMSNTIRVTNNAEGSFDEGCDFWVGAPDTVVDTTSIRFSSRTAAKSNAYPVKISLSAPQIVTIATLDPGLHTVEIFDAKGSLAAKLRVNSVRPQVVKGLVPGLFIANVKGPTGTIWHMPFLAGR